MSIPQKIKNWFSLVVLIAFALWIAYNPFLHSSWQERTGLVILLAIGFGFTIICFKNRKKTEGQNQAKRANRTPGPVPEKEKQKVEGQDIRPSLIFGGIYSIVNGLGMVKALEDYVKIINENIANFSLKTFTSIFQTANVETARLFGFFFTQVPFLHQGTILVLSADTSRLRSHPFLIFMALLVHAVLFYFVASNLLNFALFIFFLFILFAFNTAWLYVLKLFFRKVPIIPEWIQLNSITTVFIFTYFLFPYFIDINYKIADEYPSNLILAVVLFFRTVLDYFFGWKDFYRPWKAQT